MKKQNSWGWYGVKVLYESIVTGKPILEYIDENYTTGMRVLEESIIIVKAQSFEQAWKIAENKFIKEAEMTYENPYGEMVKCQLVDIIDTYHMFEEPCISGTEVYSRYLHVPIDVSNEDVLKQYYPETIESDDGEPNYNYRYTFMDFSGRRKPQEET